MNIKNRLYISSGITVVLSLVLFSAVLITSNGITEENKTRDLLYEVEEAVVELDIVAYEYLLHHEKRMAQQWESKYVSMTENLKEEATKTLRANYNALGDLFSQLIASHEKRQKLIQEKASREKVDIVFLLEERLASQLLIKSHLLFTGASRLAEEAEAKVRGAQRLATNLTLILMSILAITVLSSSIIVVRSISGPLDDLTKGAEKIGQGDFEHRVEVRARDELGNLANAFNGMVDNLKKVTASRDERDAVNLQLRSLDKLKSMFIASMSHELRTPLNSIIGFSGIMLQGLAGELNEEQKKQMTMVKSSAKHLLALINDVIDVSKVEAEKIKLDIEEFDLSRVMQEIKDSFAVAVNEKGLKLSLEEPGNMVIKSDERRIKQIVMNLISNAIKFMDKGEIKIKVVQSDGQVQISVKDAGMGIKKEDMQKLFKQFSRIMVEGMPIQEGTGLGLYLSRKLASILGGEIRAESEFGNGSEFTFIFPLKYKEV